MANLNGQNKIDFYDVTLKPFIEDIIKEESFDEIKKKYQGSLNDETLHTIQHIIECGDKSNESGFSSCNHRAYMEDHSF